MRKYSRERGRIVRKFRNSPAKWGTLQICYVGTLKISVTTRENEFSQRV